MSNLLKDPEQELDFSVDRVIDDTEKRRIGSWILNLNSNRIVRKAVKYTVASIAVLGLAGIAGNEFGTHAAEAFKADIQKQNLPKQEIGQFKKEAARQLPSFITNTIDPVMNYQIELYVESLESRYHIDLNGDGHIGMFPKNKPSHVSTPTSMNAATK